MSEQTFQPNYSAPDAAALRDLALQLLERGLAPVPQVVDESGKTPVVKWTQFRDRLPTEQKVRAFPWQKANAVALLPSHGLVVLDFDNATLGETFLDDMAARGVKTRLHRTRRGFHVYLKTSTKVEGVIPLVADGKAMAEVIGQGHLVTFASPFHSPYKSHAAYAQNTADIGGLEAFLAPWLESEGITLGVPQSRPAKPPSSLLEAVLNRLESVKGPSTNGWWQACCPFPEHDDGNPSFGVNANGFKCQVPTCAGYAGGNLHQLAALLGLPVRGSPELVNVATVQREDVHWLWRDRIPLGRITLIDGDPGVGKSWLSLAIAAAVSTGATLSGQEESRPPARALILTAEDGLGDTVRPRLEAMSADLHRIDVLTAVYGENGRERHLSLVDDLEALDLALRRGGYRLCVIDPLNAYLGHQLDTHRDAALRSVLTPLAALAERYRVAVLAIRHLTKSQRDRAIYRGQGSIAYTAAARVVHLVGQHPQHSFQRVMACVKNNLAPLPSALAFEIDALGRFRWLGETDVTPAALLAPEKADDGGALADAKTFLREELREGPVKVADLKKRPDLPASWRVMEQAKHDLAIVASREGFGKEGGWSWSLPKTANNSADSNVNSQRPLRNCLSTVFGDSHHENGVPEGGLWEPDNSPQETSSLGVMEPDSPSSEQPESREMRLF